MSPAKAPALNHIIFLYVGGNVSMPAILRFTRGVPSVEATAIPPRFAVVSLETSLPEISVVNPRIISASLTLNSLTRI